MSEDAGNVTVLEVGNNVNREEFEDDTSCRNTVVFMLIKAHEWQKTGG